MASVPTKLREFTETPETLFWQRCRQEAERRNVPAWLLAEEGFLHKPLDSRAEKP